MSLIVSVNGAYQSYFDPEHKGTINQRKNKKINSNLKENQSKLIQKQAQSSYKEGQKHDLKMRTHCYAYEIMSTPVTTISPQISIAEALIKMNQIEAHHLLIVENNTITGIISDRDLLKNTDNHINSTKKVEDVMTRKVLLCKRETEIRLIAKTMLEECISSVPVVDEDHVLQGIVTRTDLLRCIVKNMPLEVWI